MELSNKSEEFHQFLRSLQPLQKCEKVFSETYKASVLGVGCVTPFIPFVGPRDDRLTVIISKHVPKAGEPVTDESGNLEGLEIIANISDSYSKGVDDPLPISTHHSVTVGQPLAGNKAFLTHSLPFHEGWSGPSIKTTTSARDCGLVPLPLNSARFVASLYSLGCWKATETLPDVWILCERNLRGVVALGCACDAPKGKLHTFVVEANGTASKLDVATKLGKAEANLSAGSAFSEYDITSEEDGQIGTGLKIEFSWQAPDGMLSPPPECSNAVLKLSSKPGDPLSPVLFMHEELKSLFRFCEIASGKSWEMDSEEVVLNRTIGKDIEAFIREVAHPITHTADITVLSPMSDHMIYKPRTDLDFTERLWSFCRDVSSFDDLKLVFSEVFKAVLIGKVQPFVHRKSTSMLASLLRQVLLSRDEAGRQDAALKFQHLLVTESKLLLYLIQLGMEKIKRDYRSFFVGTDICSAEQFERFFDPALSTPIAQCIELCRIHTVLELNVSVMRMLKLPTVILSSLTRSAMEVLAKDPNYQPFDSTPVFNIPLSAYSPGLKSVVAMCSKLSPAVWSLATSSSDRKKQARAREASEGVDVVCVLQSSPLLSYLHDSDSIGSKDEEYCLYKCLCETTKVK